MCWGDKKSEEKTTTSTPNASVKAGAEGNINFATGLRDKGFQSYTGNQVADFGPLQSQSFDSAGNIASQPTAYVPQVEDYFSTVGGTGPGHVTPERISQNMDPYMNQYVMQALGPQLHQQDIQFANQDKKIDAGATMSGAFGDTGWGQQRGVATGEQDIARQGLIGQAYNSAFNTAIGAGAQDTATNLQGQTTNAQLEEQALARKMAAGQQFQNLGTYDLGQEMARAQLANTFGQQQTGKSQAELNAAFQQWMMAQQYPFQTAGLVNQTVAAGAQAMPATKTETTTKPDNSGWALAGTLGGAALGSFVGMPGLGASLGGALGGGLGNTGTPGMGNSGAPEGTAGPMGSYYAQQPGGYTIPTFYSDERLKENIEKAGELADGTPVHLFTYKGDPTKARRLGLIAQEVERRRPDAVVTMPSGYKAVDYGKATEFARAFAMAA